MPCMQYQMMEQTVSKLAIPLSQHGRWKTRQLLVTKIDKQQQIFARHKRGIQLEWRLHRESK